MFYLLFSDKIVITDYNMKTYRIDDIAWNENPTATFKMREETVSYLEYYKKVMQYVLPRSTSVEYVTCLYKEIPIPRHY